jgi:hypothetical protein
VRQTLNFPKTTLLLSLSILASPSQAGWGDFVNDVTNASKQLISNELVNSTTKSNLSTDTIISGLKQALETGARYAIDNAGKTNGYLSNELIRIAMPPKLEQASGLMRKFGLSQLADDFETSMNRAAEEAAPKATEIIINAIKNMTIDDATSILNGPDDAATEYFKNKTSEQLTALFEPAIKNSLNKVGTTKYYNDLTTQIADIPFVGQSINLDLPDYVTTQALDGLFSMIAVEEKKIRENPAARTTELLKQVFSK